MFETKFRDAAVSGGRRDDKRNMLMEAGSVKRTEAFKQVSFV
jgi:hypothetical protein